MFVSCDSGYSLCLFWQRSYKRQWPFSPRNRSEVSDHRYREGGLLKLDVEQSHASQQKSRMVVGLSLNKRMSRKLVINVLQTVIWRRSPPSGLIFHSHRGRLNCSRGFQGLLRKHRMKSSMSLRANCCDNSFAENFFGSLKAEQVNGSSYLTSEEAKRDVKNYMENNSKRRTPICDTSAQMILRKRWT